MRQVGEIAHPECKITIFSWNNRYLVKFEQGYLEQTFKIDQFDVAGDEELKKILDPEFIQATLQRFQAMAESWSDAINRAPDK
jgi:hypothetical protein